MKLSTGQFSFKTWHEYATCSSGVYAMAGHTTAMATGAGKHASFNLSKYLETSNGSESQGSKQSSGFLAICNLKMGTV